jgi:hypothetical protein
MVSLSGQHQSVHSRGTQIISAIVLLGQIREKARNKNMKRDFGNIAQDKASSQQLDNFTHTLLTGL